MISPRRARNLGVNYIGGCCGCQGDYLHSQSATETYEKLREVWSKRGSGFGSSCRRVGLVCSTTITVTLDGYCSEWCTAFLDEAGPLVVVENPLRTPESTG